MMRMGAVRAMTKWDAIGPVRIQVVCLFFFFQAEDGIRDLTVTGVQTCALPICRRRHARLAERRPGQPTARIPRPGRQPAPDGGRHATPALPPGAAVRRLAAGRVERAAQTVRRLDRFKHGVRPGVQRAGRHPGAVRPGTGALSVLAAGIEHQGVARERRPRCGPAAMGEPARHRTRPAQDGDAAVRHEPRRRRAGAARAGRRPPAVAAPSDNAPDVSAACRNHRRMSAQHLKLIAGGLVVLLLLWGGSELLSRGSDSVTESLALPALSQTDVDTISLVKGADSVVLARQAPAAWSVNGYRAAPDAVGEVFKALADTARPELVAQAASSFARLGVDSAAGRWLRLSRGREPLLQLVVGTRAQHL